MKEGRTADSYRQKPWGTDNNPKKLVVDPTPPSPEFPQPYPRHVKDADGNTHVVQDHEHEATITGVAMNPDGTPDQVALKEKE